jgi:hypothetical protein
MSENKNKLINELTKRLGISQNQMQDAMKSGNVEDVLKNADSSKAQQIQSILNDPEKTREIMNSPQAQALLKLFNNDQ